MISLWSAWSHPNRAVPLRRPWSTPPVPPGPVAEPEVVAGHLEGRHRYLGRFSQGPGSASWIYAGGPGRPGRKPGGAAGDGESMGFSRESMFKWWLMMVSDGLSHDLPWLMMVNDLVDSWSMMAYAFEALIYHGPTVCDGSKSRWIMVVNAMDDGYCWLRCCLVHG